MTARATVLTVALAAVVALAAAPGVARPGSGAPGSLITTEPITAPAGAQAWRVRYHSRALDGRDVAVSGIVVAPLGRAPAGGRPVFSWAHGTAGLADRCAPSRAADAASALPWVRELLDRGYVIAATDYEGLGTPGPHPYLVGESEGRSVLDAARAATHVAAADASRTVLVAGHSQGGQAALFAGEVARRYAPDLDVRGVAALAPATELDRLLAQASSDSRGFAAMIAEGIRAAFPDADAAVDAVLTPEARAALRTFDHDACLYATLAGFRDHDITVFRASPTSRPSIRTALRRSTAGNVATRIPIAVYQGGLDSLVPAAATATYVVRACARGDRIAATVYPDADHGTVLDAASSDLLRWLDDRRAGAPAPENCPRRRG